MESEKPSINIPYQDVIRVSQFVSENIGLEYTPERMKDLEKGIITACFREGLSDTESCLKWVRSADNINEKIHALALSLTIGETYFFRDKNLFRFLRDEFFPRLITRAREHGNSIRIWSAGCSSGEEPYSLSILLYELIPDIKDWNIQILATDINNDALDKAKKGEYSSWSFRDNLFIIKDNFFQIKGNGKYKINDNIKNIVKFQEINLITDSYPDTRNGTILLDLILCRNVLMYFSKDKAAKVIEGFHNALKDEGYLIVSPQEISYLQNQRFTTIIRDDVFLHKKVENSNKDNESVLTHQIKFTYSQDYSHFLPEPVQRSFDSITVNEDSFDTDDEASKKIWAEVSRQLSVESSKFQDKPRIGALSEAKKLADNNRFEEALVLCNKALESDRLNPKLHYLKATIHQENGNVPEAVKSLRQALYADKNYIPAHLNLGTLMKKEGKEKESRRHFQNALISMEGHEDSEILEDLGGMTVGRIRVMIEDFISEANK